MGRMGNRWHIFSCFSFAGGGERLRSVSVAVGSRVRVFNLNLGLVEGLGSICSFVFGLIQVY